MRNLKMFLFSSISIALICTIIVFLVNIKVRNGIMSMEIKDFIYFLPVLILLPLSHLLWGSYVQYSDDLSHFNELDWDKTLKKFSVTALSSSNLKKVYKIPFIKMLFPAEITVAYKETRVIITAPRRVIYEYRKG